ncbi:efflux RND transporter periplasmic adaptor subunit [Granulicella cerasi]|uniref:Efflux RND transporter periplasmic adaptor subunit n=1 Tax=Granulicella cerasi TaxID=741063 RepID=A0ABW1Z7S5_9BACT|nr:efflux RND transporter periplasmic adaptor subunit [Granulicella cerasi]
MPNENLHAHGQPAVPTALQQEGLRDTSPSTPGNDHEQNPHNQVLQIDTRTRLGQGPRIPVLAVVAILLVAIVIGIASRHHSEKELNEATDISAVQTVAVIHASSGAASQELRLPANTEAYVDTPIFSRTNGYLQKWFADIGQHVEKGQLLAIVQTPEVDQQVQQAEAEVNTAKANAQLAEITSNRWKALLAKNAVSRQEADQASSDLTARQAALNSAEANLRRLQQMQGFERIYAPFSGIITARNVDIGSLIQAGDSTNTHAELFHLSSIDQVRVFVPVPEVHAAAVHDGEQVKVTSDAFPNEVFTGTIARNSRSIDSSTRTLNMEVDLENHDHKLLPGQYAFVHLPLAAGDNSLTLPSNAILFRAEGLRVGVVRNNHVHLQPIEIGHDYGATVEVISGLTPQDDVIINPSDSLAEGQEVRVAGGTK